MARWFFIFMFYVPVSFSAPWRIEGKSVPSNLEKRLKEKYPSIEGRQEAQSLLRELAHQFELESGDVHLQNDVWVFRLQPGASIKVIDFRLASRMFRQQLDAVAANYLGQVDSTDISDQLTQAIRQYLKTQGYPRPEIHFSRMARDGGIRYRYRVDNGPPCLISSVNTNFRIPLDIELDLRPGDICDRTRIDESLKTLESELKEEGYNEAKFDPPRTVYDPQLNSMKIMISGSLGKRLRYEIRDQDTKLLLTDIFTASEIEDLDPTIIGPEAMMADIKQRYQARGYDDVIVSGPEMLEGENDRVTYRFVVNAGTYYKIEDVQFQGNLSFNQNQLNDRLNLSDFFSTSTPLNMERVQQGIDQIRSLYRSSGFWDVEIKDPKVTKNRELGTAQLLVTIEEGQQRFYSSLEIKGVQAFEKDEFEDLVGLDVGEPLDQSRLIDLEKKIRERYLTEAYLYVDVTLSLEQRSGQNKVFVAINVIVREGQRIKIGDISILGLVTTDRKVVARELYFSTGDFYDPEVIDSSRRALLALGIFQTVQIIPADRNATTEQSSVIDLNVVLKESKPGNVSFGPGWSLVRGNRFSAESSYSNIGGVGRQVFGRGQLSEDAHQKAIGPKTLIGRTLSLGYVEPYLFDIPINGVASVSNSARADERWQLSSVGEVALVHKFRKFLFGSTLTLFFNQKINREVSSEEERNAYLRLIGGNVRTARFGLRYFYDHRNDITWPERGYILSSEVSQARYILGGNLSYRSWQFGYSQYFGIGQRTVLALGMSLEAFEKVQRKGNEADMLPQSETLYVGGAETVRGFAERSLGPRVSFSGSENEDLGGSHAAYFKVELRRKLYWDAVAGTVFVDTGNVFFTPTEVADFRTKESLTRSESEAQADILDNVPYRYEELLEKPEYIWTKHYAAYGIALNYLTPLGSLNLAYGLPWKRCAEKGCAERGARTNHWLTSGTAHVNIGTQF